ncbi:lonely Cys domain-containing protein [Streptomyces sp. FXJ1.4098]|nr:lonely Cys domain-containing protein [Streptomyces sp. FXJ1.4098]
MWGDKDPAGVRFRDGQVLSAEELAGELAADPELAKLPQDVPVVLVVPYLANERYLEYMRAVANRLGRTVWSPSGDGRLVRNKKREHVPALIDHGPDQPIGAWVPFHPTAKSALFVDREWTALDGTTFRDSDVDSRPVVSDRHERFGRMSHADDVRDREQRLRSYLHAKKLVHLVPSGGRTALVSEEKRPPSDPAVYSFVAHGLPGGLQLALRGGRTVWLSAADGGRYIGGLREVSELPDGHRMGLEVCWGGSAGNPLLPQLDNRPALPVDDPLAEVSLSQHTANASRRVTNASVMSSGFFDDARILLDTPGGVAGRREDSVPEPLPRELDDMAVKAGLHSGEGEAPPAVRAVTLRLVRALRNVFGPEAEADRDLHQQLLKGIGAMEIQRANDPALSRFTPFRMELWTFIAQRVGGKAPDRDAYRKVLDFAAKRLAEKPDARLSEDIADPYIQHALNQVTKLGAGLVRTVLRQPETTPVTQRAVTRVFWAMAGAAQRMGGMDAAFTERLGREVLHMPPDEQWTPAKKQELWILTAQAIGTGLDPSDYFTLAAFHLASKGAFGPAHLLKEGETVRGYNWSGTPAPDGVYLRVVGRQDQEDGGTSLKYFRAAWTADGEPEDVMVVWTDTDADGFVVLHLPGMPPLRLPDQEFLALLDLAPMLRATPLGVPLVFVVSGAGGVGSAGRPSPLSQVFTDRTGRNGWAYGAPLTVVPTTPPAGAASAPLRILGLPEAGTGKPGRWSKTWLDRPDPTTITSSATQGAALMSSPPPRTAPPAPSDATDPLLSPATLMRDASGVVRGRTLTHEQVLRVRTDRVLVVQDRPGEPEAREPDEPAPWGGDAYMVDGELVPGGVRILGGQVLTYEEFAEKLGDDPELAKLPKDVPVVLAVPYAARRQYMALQRAVAIRLGRRVWAPSGDGRLRYDGELDAHVLALVDPGPDRPLGVWAPFDPPTVKVRYTDREWTALDGTEFRDSDVDTMPLVDENHERFGLESHRDDEPKRRTAEQRYRLFRSARRLTHFVPVSDGLAIVGSEELPPQSAVHTFVAHGKPGRVGLSVQGRTVFLSTRDAGRYIGGLQEVAELPPGHKLDVVVCWGESEGDPSRPQPSTAPAPFVDDPLEDVPLGQRVANESRREATTYTRQTGAGDTGRMVIDGPGGEAARRVTHRPEPLDHELDALAREAELHRGPGAGSPETRRTTLRLVRALKRAFGEGVQDDPRFTGMFQGVAALERMRAGDPELSRLTPFHMGLWTFLARRSGGFVPTRADYLAVLDDARDRLAADPDARLAPAPDPALAYSLDQLTKGGDAHVRTLLRLGSSAQVDPRQVAWALWAGVAASQRIALPPRDVAELGGKVLHLRDRTAWDPSRVPALWQVTAKAIAQGADALNSDVLAAYHLEESGAFHKSRLLRSSDPGTAGESLRGLNWSGRPAPNGIEWDRVHEVTTASDGTTTAKPYQPTWRARQPDMPILLLTDTDQAGNLVLHLPKLRAVPVSQGEFLALTDLMARFHRIP